MKLPPGPWEWVDGALFDSEGKGVPWDWFEPRVAKWPDMLSLLEAVEWSAYADGFGPACPVCGGHRDHGHHGEKVNVNIKPACRLGALLSELRRP